jgi:hypothetical protein
MCDAEHIWHHAFRHEFCKDALRILVVDDDLDTAQSMTYLLLDLGHQVMFTNNGESAVEIALPGVGPLHIYAVTGYPDEHSRRRTERTFDGHFLKPMHPDVLDNLVGALCERAA